VIDDYLSAVLRSIGKERFAMFWKSSEPPGIAFQNATGQSIGDWTLEWVHYTVGRTARGSQVSALTIVVALMLIAGGLALTAALANERAAG
jgi:hypothetical protein